MLLAPPPAAHDTVLQTAIADARRLAAVVATGLLDTPPEEGFDRLTRLAARIIGAPVTFMTLVDGQRDFYKSHSGFGEPLASTRQLTGRTFCHYGLTAGGPLVLDDVTAHAGYADVPTVRTLGIRAYAGVPMVTGEGQCIGSFCAVDFQPRHWTEQDIQLLTELGHAAMREIALRDALRQAEAASQAKSAFLSNISHEIRTPMNAIIGITHLMARDSADAEQRDRLQMVNDAARHLLLVINDVLDLSKVEAGKMSLDEGDFVLQEQLQTCVDLVADRARAKGLDLQLDAGNLPPRLCGDATKLRQALLNLLSNAVKFTDRGWVRLSGQCLGEQGDRVLVRFEVHDTGPGIAPEAMPRLFNAFSQADESVARRHGGTGLGLALTRSLAWLMDGDAGASSEPGRGSCFWFTAWLRQAGSGDTGVDLEAPALVAAEAELRHRHLGRWVLLAEDNLVNQLVARELLQAAGLQVEQAVNGRSAVEMACSRAFDLVLMDMQMPVLDGLAATRQIRQCLGAQLPIIAMTANAFGEDRQACLDAGMNDHVAKPVDPVHLYQTLLRWLPATGA